MKNILPCFLIALLLLTACGKQVPSTKKLAPLPAEGTCKIAILPFLNESNYLQGGDMVAKIFHSELAASGQFQLLQEGDVRNIYQQLLLYPNRLPSREQLKMIGGRLNPDLLVGGIVQKMYQRDSGNFVDTELTLILLLYHGKTGELLWITYHRRRGEEYQQLMHIGRLKTLTALARRMSQEIITNWTNQGMLPCPE